MKTIQIKIVDTTCRVIKLLVDLNETIGSAKKKYCNKLGPLDYNREKTWTFDHEVLEDNEIFSDIGIEDGDIINCTSIYNGGGNASRTYFANNNS